MRFAVAVFFFAAVPACGSVESDPAPDGDSDSDVDSDADADTDSDSDTDDRICWEFGLWAAECYPKVYSAVEASNLCECTACLATPDASATYYECVTGIGCLDGATAEECMGDALAQQPPGTNAQALDQGCRERHDECSASEAWGAWGSNPNEFDCTAMVLLNETAAEAALPCVEQACGEIRDCLVAAANDVCGCNFQP